MVRRPTKSATHKVGDYSLVPKFNGYRAREDHTILEPGTLISPSKNVISNTSGRVGQVSGYALDGAASPTIDSGILSSYDFTNFKGDVRNMRAGFLTSAGNDGKLQYRYRTGSGTNADPYVVNWITLASGLTNVRLSYTNYWDNTALVPLLTWVDGSNNVFQWNGAVTQLASATATTVTKTGTRTWAQEGFATSGTRSIVINGVPATYSGGENTTTLTGVSVDYSAYAANSIIHQQYVTTALSTMTSILATFGPTLVGCGQKNQLYLGSSSSNVIYISKVNDFTNYAYTTPVRVAGEGFNLPLDEPPTKFIPQEDRTKENATDMYISQGLNHWSVIEMIPSSDLSKETITNRRLKVAPLLGAKSERLVTKMKNEIVFLANDKTVNFFGYQSYQYVPAIIDFGYTIIDDLNSYDFTDASVFYHKNLILLAIPAEGLIRVYNMTDQSKQYTSYFRDIEDVTQQPWYWEAPITYPISGFYVVDGELYGHSYTTSESYKLFTGGSFNGQDIETNATFAYDDHGDRTQSKGSDEIWVEGYIKQNTKLTVTVAGDMGTLMTSQTTTIDGADKSIVSYGSGGGSLGKDPLGSKPYGGTDLSTSTLPAWFHVAKTYPQVPSYLELVSFSSKGVDLQWELITFGTNAKFTPEGNNAITQ